ncbi:hypothetical protein P875_00127777 [Aspergillus parasiticus SU-1]|uniref:Uncharacterized protein n=1 Tax=Aspergillus parasiticus (strain ATCC 56775 / NRRL 5862 / SRRC 143 / SU-1) TaxID=1403190 RepID=A0A0F0IGQ9_ASPPU|nr:hypothetical protein P875_00127777 [Aspergillus parasiticus SU-1]
MSNKPKPDTLLGLTNSEQKILLLSILCTDESNKLDLDKLAQYGGYKNPASASTTYRNAKRKLSDYKPEPSTSAEGSAANTPKRGRPPKKAAAAEPPMAANTEPVEEEAAPAPKAKRQRIIKKGIAKVIKKDSYDSEDTLKSEPSSSIAETKGSIKSEDSSVKGEDVSIKEEMRTIKQEPEDIYDDCKTEDESLMTNDELDAQLDAMYEAAHAGVKAEAEGEA